MKQFVVLALLVSLFCAVSIASADFGTDWQADYYNSTDLSGAFVYSETFPNGININWGTGSPNPAVNTDNFSARFTSTQTFEDGDYVFAVSSDDGVRVFIDNVLVLDRFFGRVLTTDNFINTFTAGVHSLRVEYVEFTDQAAIQVQWFKLDDAGGGLPPGIYDGRANATDLAAPVAAYCQSYGLDIYAIDAEGHGTLAFTVTGEQLKEAEAETDGVLLASGEGVGGTIELWHTADGQLLLRAHGLPPEDKLYDFVWGGCA